MFFSCFCLDFKGFSGAERGQKILGVLAGFPWYLPKHQGKEDQETVKKYMLATCRTLFDIIFMALTCASFPNM